MHSRLLFYRVVNGVVFVSILLSSSSLLWFNVGLVHMHGFLFKDVSLDIFDGFCVTLRVVFLFFGVFQYSETAVVPRASILETEVEWLNSIKADLVVL